MIYVNRAWFQGRVVSKPTIKSLNSQTKVTSFSLSMVESWDDSSGQHKERKNVVTIEVAGRDAERIAAEAGFGSWVTLEGYLRSEYIRGECVIKVRTLRIDVWSTHDGSSDPVRGGDGPDAPGVR